jgi:hypothetical protein
VERLTAKPRDAGRPRAERATAGRRPRLGAAARNPLTGPMLECEPAWPCPSRPVARMPDPKIAGLIERMLGGDRLALARVITHVENNTASVPAIIKATHRSGRESYAVSSQVAQNSVPPVTALGSNAGPDGC